MTIGYLSLKEVQEICANSKSCYYCRFYNDKGPLGRGTASCIFIKDSPREWDLEREYNKDKFR